MEIGKTRTLDLSFKGATVIPLMQLSAEKILLQGGKRFRPKLCFAFGEGLGLLPEQIHPFSRAAEWVHSATLSHDDVLDEATRRRNRKTLNSKLSEAKAVLTGDIMLARVIVELADTGEWQALKRIAEVVEHLVTGEWLQLDVRGSLDINEVHLQSIHLYKSASLIEWCCEVPFLIAKRNEEEIYHAKNFGRCLGLAFQSLDDSNDAVKDLGEGTLNWVTVGMLQSQPRYREVFAGLMNLKTGLSESLFFESIEKEDFDQARRRTLSRVRRYGDSALRSLEALSDVITAESFDELRELVKVLLKETE